MPKITVISLPGINPLPIPRIIKLNLDNYNIIRGNLL